METGKALPEQYLTRGLSELTSSRIFMTMAEDDSAAHRWEIWQAEGFAEKSPEVVEILIKHHIDSLHGATSLSLE
ncbi:MAG TPA: hypothetical protein VD907_05255 [Verrucomicrobiae bacterium]|nr:hypothetical protein [Verrucomicrobiae bacterium]